MTEKQKIIKDFLEDWYDMPEFYKEHPDFESFEFKTIPQFLNEIQLYEDHNIFDVKNMFLHWIQHQYNYSKSKAEAIVSIISDFNDQWNQNSIELKQNDYILQVPIYKKQSIKLIEYKMINYQIKETLETLIEFA